MQAAPACFRAIRELLHRWHEPLIAPRQQLLSRCNIRWMRVEVVTRVGVVSRSTDDFGQMQSNRFGIR